MANDWSDELKKIASQVLNCENHLQLFPSRDANEITKHTVFRIKTDCSCSLVLTNLDQSAGFAESDQSITDLETSTGVKIPAFLRESHNIIQLDTHDEVKWTIPVITHGLALHMDQWDVVKHCAHIYCYWLNYLFPTNRNSLYSTAINLLYPRAIRHDPNHYLGQILFSLCHFFLPRPSEPLSHQRNWLINSLGQTLTTAQKKEVQAQADTYDAPPTTLLAITEASTVNQLLHLQLDITHQIVQAIESVLANGSSLTPSSWEMLLQFGLNACHAVLALPLPIANQATNRSTTAGSSNSSHPTNVPAHDSIMSSASGIDSHQHPALRTTEAIVDLLAGMLMNIWVKACTHCFPRPPMWSALRACCKVWRHQSMFVAHWARVLITATNNLVSALYDISMVPQATESLAVDRSGVPLFSRDIPLEGVKEIWYRFIFLLGNPVDLMDPRTLATPVFEKLKGSQVAERVHFAQVYMPFIYHQALRAFSVVVDAFLGIQPSLTIGVEPSYGVPIELYRPVVTNNCNLPNSLRSMLNEQEALEVKKMTPSTVSGGNYSSGMSLKGSRKLKVMDAHRASVLEIPLPTTISVLSYQSSQISSTPSSQIVFFNKIPQPPPFSPSTSPFIIRLSDQSNQWLGPEPNIDVFSKRPDANTLLRLLGRWLFEAAVMGVDKDIDVAVISSRSAQYPSFLSFNVGRAEALGSLCRILLYSNQGRLDEKHLAHFYLALYYGLDTENVRDDFVLSTLLFYAVDLLRVDLPGINILLPRLFAACQVVLKENTMIRPEYLSMLLIRRAAIHQLMSMVCIPVQFKGTILKSLIPISSNAKDPMALDDLKAQLAYLLCDCLESEKDPVNFKMLLSTSLALLEDMAVDEGNSPLIQRPRKGDARMDYKRLNSASSYLHNLIPCLCKLLTNVWSTDTVAQDLLEALSGIARIRVNLFDPTKYRETVCQLCEFITSQCQRHSKYHKRQLHSVIAAAYLCLSLWLVEHAQCLLTDRGCLQTVLSTIELGICGQKSKAPPDAPLLKSEKQLTPSSKRVQDAAEYCLSILISLSNSNSTGLSETSTGSALCEEELIRFMIPLEEVDAKSDLVNALRARFRYFWSDVGMVLGLLELAECHDLLREQSFPVESHILPETVLVLRSAFGRHCWFVRMRQRPVRGYDQTYDSSSRPNRPEPWGCFLEKLLNTVDQNQTIRTPNFSEQIQEIPLVNADYALGTLDEVGGKPGSQSRKEIDHLKSIIASESSKNRDIALKQLADRLSAPYPSPVTDTKPPSISDSPFQVCRLFLMHFGYLAVNTFSMLEAENMKNANILGSNSRNSLAYADKTPAVSSAVGGSIDVDPCPLFYDLNIGVAGFYPFLDSVDRLPTRTGDTLLVFYVASGQTKYEDILSNMHSWSSLSAEFHQFMDDLGSFTSVAEHTGWTGDLATSYTPRPLKTVSGATKPRRLDCAPDGHQYIVHHADALTELACICPSDQTMAVGPLKDEEPTPKNPPSYRRSDSLNASHRSQHSIPGEIGGDPTGGRVALVWLECWEDGQIASGTESAGLAIHKFITNGFNCPVTIYVHTLSSQLFRIGVCRSPEQVYNAGPLINGMVLSRRCLANFVRQTVSNIARRRRLASDQFQPPHVRRKYRIGELGQSCRYQHEEQTDINTNRPHILLNLFSPANSVA